MFLFKRSLLSILFIFILLAPMSSFAGTTSYLYDELDRLKVACFDTTVCTDSGSINRIIYTYDEIGNLLSKMPAGNVVTITSSAAGEGSIYPAGTTTMFAGSSKAYSMKPAAGFRVGDVLIDGVRIDDDIIIGRTSADGITSYPFLSVIQNHTIQVNFVSDVLLTITATAGAGGAISPSGTTTIAYGKDLSYTITPITGYHVEDVKVDGVSVGAVRTYKFEKIKNNHTISASFAIDTFKITTTAGSNGTISPPSPIVNYGSSQTLTIAPAVGYHVTGIIVDGAPVSVAVDSMKSETKTYTFSNVTATHTISATFAINMYPITVIQGIGEILPETALIPHGSGQTFSISHTSRYLMVAVKVDGVSQGITSTYTFSNVTAPHTIEAAFSLIPCSNPPAKIAGTENYFTTLQAAYNAATTGATILTQGQLFPENFVANRDISITIDGGYTCEYAATASDKTMLQGEQKVEAGAVDMKNIKVMQ